MKTVNFEPIREQVNVLTGTNLLQTLLAKQFNVLMACGGKGLCATCHVHVNEGMDKLSDRTERERMTLSFISGTDARSRLACQCRVLGDGVVVELPQGMYIERAEDLLSLLGTRAPTDILHPLKGTVLIAKGKIITRTQIEALKSLNTEMTSVRGRPLEESGRKPLATVPPPAAPASRPPAPEPEAAPPPPVASAHPSKKFSLGATLGKCVLLEKIGQGSTGIVYRGLHKTLNIPVAVKVLHFDDSENDRQLYDKFQTEARLLAQLNHPNIVRVWDFEDDAHAPYLVLEHVEGLSLDELIRQSGRLLLDRAAPLMRQVTQALAAAWKLGIVHRDVKPANILVARDGTAKLADLGLALIVEQRSTTEGTTGSGLAGTVAYMSPEQASGGRVDHRSDIYALGATFYHAVTGRFPFSGRSRMELLCKHAQEAPVPPHAVVPELSPAASTVILRMLAKQPQERFADYAALEAALAELETCGGAVAAAGGGPASTHHAAATEVAAEKPTPRRTLLNIFGWRRTDARN